MRNKMKHLLTICLSSMLFSMAFGVSVHAEEVKVVTGISQCSENERTKEEIKSQIYDALNDAGITVTYDAANEGISKKDDSEAAAASTWPAEIPKPPLDLSPHSGYYHDWIWRVDNTYAIPDFIQAIDPNSSFCYLVNPFNNSASTIQLPYMDAKGKEQTGSGRVVRIRELYSEGYNVETVVDNLYKQFEAMYGDLMVFNEAVMIDRPDYFWASGEVQLAMPEIYITEYTDGSIELDGTVYLVLIQYDKDGKVLYDYRTPYYRDQNRLFNAIVEMQILTNTIVSRVQGQHPVEKVKYFHWYLTRMNELNMFLENEEDIEALYASYPDAFNALGALRGSVGPKAPVELSYALALKHLCNKAGIKCAVVGGLIGPLDNKKESFWNMVELTDALTKDFYQTGSWYAVNAALDDLAPNTSGKAVSGYESEMYFLPGMNTVVQMAGEEILFGLSHSERNMYYTGYEYKNGPKLCPHEYIYPVTDIKLSATETNYMYGYMDAPVITTEAVLISGATNPGYAWILVDPQGKETVLPSSETQITFPEVTVPGTYKIRSVVAFNNITKSKEITINVTIFQDVNESHWFYNAVDWAMENGITYGLNNSTFGSSTPCTRAQIVTFLWRAAGSPQAENTTNKFKDVTADAYYYDAILWAVENGITSGYRDDEFAPDNSCTRAEMVTFLWRAAGKAEADEKEHPFEDVEEDSFYFEAMLWAISEGVAAGYTETEFAPLKTVTRAETVTFLYRANGHPIAAK